MRKDLLIVGGIYHVFNRSISEFKIFNNDSEFSRMIQVMSYYQNVKPKYRFSDFKILAKVETPLSVNREKLVEIVVYCLMPTHFHFVLRQLKEKGISLFMSNVLNSYTRYFNIKHNRKGPLWESRFKNVHIKTDEQLLHLTRYIHLNPVTAFLVNKPEDWKASSYLEYLSGVADNLRICDYN